MHANRCNEMHFVFACSNYSYDKLSSTLGVKIIITYTLSH
jgi:hypothetical protein